MQHFSQLLNDISYNDNVITVKEAKNTTSLIEIIDNLLLKYLKIQARGGTDVLLNEQQKRKSAICSGASKLLFQVLNITAPRSSNQNQFNITVDADKSKMNLGSLLLFLCDQVAAYPATEINFFNTIATKYDAASGSGTEAYLEKIEQSLKAITENGTTGKYTEVDQPMDTCQVTIHVGDLVLLTFSYTLNTTNEEDTVIKKFLEMITDCINKLQPVLEKSWPNFEQNKEFVNTVTDYFQYIDNKKIFPKGLPKTKINQLKILLEKLVNDKKLKPAYGDPNETFTKTSISFPHDLKTDSLSYSSIESGKGKTKFQLELNNFFEKEDKSPLIINQKDVLFYFLIVQIIKYFQNYWKEALKYVSKELGTQQTLASLQIHQFFSTHPTVPILNETQCSVSSITGTICNLDCLGTGTMESEEFAYQSMLYKTYSDFGQIAVFYCTVMNNISAELSPLGTWNQGRNIFISFDRICSRIACLFIAITIYENLDKEAAVAPITVFVDNTLYTPAIEAAGNLIGFSSSGFGKKTKIKKPKIKYPDKVIKLAKKYNINLDKNTIKNLKNLYNVQKSAKKLNIKITKKTSTGKRIYKTEKELIKNIKEYNQSHNNKTLQKVKLLREKAKKKKY